MESIIQHVLREMRVISGAPVAFFGALLVLAVGIYWALDWRYGGVIVNRDAELSSVRAQRDDYKEKLSGASPDQAAQRIAALEAKVKLWEPRIQRRLTADQKQKLVAALTPLAAEIKNIAVFSDFPELSRYALDFMRIFKQSGIASLGVLQGFGQSDDDHGILVGLLNPNAPSDLAKKYIAALKTAGLEIKTTKWGSIDQPATVPQGQIDFDLFICEPQ